MRPSDLHRRYGGRETASLLGVLTGLLLTGQVLGWSPLDRTETWSAPGTAGWSNQTSGITLTNMAGRLDIGFASQFTPRLVEGVTWKAVDPGTRLTNITLRIAASNLPPSQVYLCLHSRLNGNTWYYRLPDPAVGAEIDCSVPVEYSIGWRKGPLSTPEGFLTDVQTLDWVGVHMRRNGDTAAQLVGLDDVRLQGQSWPEDRDLDGIENDWEIGYGLLPDDPRDSSLDGDNDGMSNYSEARAGTDPTNGLSRFLIHSGTGEPGGTGQRMKVWWSSISNRSYTVWRTTDLNQPFEPVQVGLASTPGTNVFEDAATTNLGRAFYRVDVDP